MSPESHVSPSSTSDRITLREKNEKPSPPPRPPAGQAASKGGKAPREKR